MASFNQALDAVARTTGDIASGIKRKPGIASAITGLLSDPYATLTQDATQLLVNTTVHYGVIADGIPYVQVYRVLPETGNVLQTCTTLRDGCSTAVGVADISTYTPGTRVLYAKHPDHEYGWILGAVPAYSFDPRAGRSYSIGSASCCGLRCEDDYATPMRMGGTDEVTSGGIIDYSNRTPTDSLLDGAKGWVTETGLMLSMDAYMAQIRVDAMTGLFLFYWDRLCRVAGHNYQLWTAGSVLESYDDEGEHYWQHGVATYLWEQAGNLIGPTEYFEKHSAIEVQKEKPWLQRLEPKELDAQPFLRVQEYGGYIGQGHRRYIAVPPPGVDWFTQSEPLNVPGLAEQAVTLGGQILQRTATGLVLAKYPVIPIPKRMKSHTDKDGDSADDNYRPAGNATLGNGPEHKVGVMPTVSGRDLGSVKAGGLLDLHAYLFNWSGVSAFHYHEKDYHLPDEEDCEWVGTDHTPNFRSLKHSHALPEPPHTLVKVDERTGNVKIYHNTCSVTLLDDGGVVVVDGAGAEITLTGGNARVTAPGDISLEAGRNIVLGAGRDVIVKAKQSVDLSATDKDVRVKAQNNVQMVAGVGGGPHGVLIESLGTGMYFENKQGHEAKHGGVIMVAPKAAVMGVASDIYLRTGGPGIASGVITLDAAQGRGTIITNSATFTRFIGSQCVDMFTNDGVTRGANVWTANGAWINGWIAADKGIIVTGPALFNGYCWAVAGAFISDSTEIRPPDGESKERVQVEMNKVINQLTTQLPRVGDKLYQAYEDRWYELNRPGNADVLRGLHFSFRTTDDYGTADWHMYEPRWAQMARHDDQQPDVWQEQPVTWNNRDTYPYPGSEALLGMTYYQVNGGLHDPATGRAVARGEAYENAEITDQLSGTPTNKSYPIIG